ncbi:flagellar basal-body rod modification protein FlgD [Inhella inkyongensis]|uniref:Basal-body rod modification protein FlgD n=1 Tax=Inhella inkyongensis TaxID=392593 RepID=A0A840SBV4_9BURK|nr:flagellar hook capping FlgD N-terminal domain-containing protein [Inhella inkyongensis]MBB5205941.1 flagellar basal-body rod modification protein FlgD [Inhella inkyongensis]
MDIGSLLGSASSASGSKAAQKAQETQDRFLTLLVAQMKNQDPMSPMENAELTTQLAQIQTVTGVDQLNTNIEKLGSQFNQSQALQGVALMGRDVTLAGNRLSFRGDHSEGQFELSGAADHIEVEVTTAAGTVIDKFNLGSAGAGTHTFNWSKPGFEDGAAELHFRVNATRGAKPVPSTTFTRDLVTAISTKGGTLSVQLASGGTAQVQDILSVD